MPCLSKYAKLSVALAMATFAVPSISNAQHFTQKNLVSDISQPNNADGSAVLVDPNLKNPWGLSRSASSPWWVANNNSGTSTLYTGAGIPPNAFPDPHPDSNGNGINSPFNNFVMVPPAGFAPGTASTPTGTVFNGSTDFQVAPGKAALFIFATEDGTISGWNPGVDVTNAILKVDNSDKGSAHGAVYKGLTSGEINGKRFLYAANFRSARVEVYDTNFHRVRLGEDAFDDEGIPRDYAPFNVQNIGGSLFVTYAKQNADRHDDVAGDGFGFVDIFSTSGKLEGRLQHGDWMNAPWGVVWTPRDFGEFSNVILVGNFGSGWIAAFNGFTKKFIGFMRNPDDSLVTIDGLWSLTFGNNGGSGSSTTLYFSAGINNEQDGLFGTLTPIAAEQDGDEE